MRHWLCRESWFVACTCGVSVREGNTVLSVDMCGGKHKATPRPKVTQLSDGKLKGASVTRDVAGLAFAVTMLYDLTKTITKTFNWLTAYKDARLSLGHVCICYLLTEM